MRQAPEIFVSYSHRDSAWRDRLFGKTIATSLGDCTVWSDAWLRAGDRWEEEIDARLEGCAVAVLLASPNFLASNFIQTRELPRLLARSQQGTLRVCWVPVGLSPSQVTQSLPDLARLQAARPLGDALPAQLSDWDDDRLASAKQRLDAELKRALDPDGADLAQHLAPRYALGLRIGEGNRATIFKAHDQHLGREVAVKVFRDPDAAQRAAFMADVRRSIRLSEEPNYLNLYDCSRGTLPAYCVQQLVQGRTLRERLAELGPGRHLHVASMRRVFHRLVRAIARAHDMNVTYGNLKPGNVMLDQDDEPFILPVSRQRAHPQDLGRLRLLLDRLAVSRAEGTPVRDSDAEDLAYQVPDLFGDALDAIDAKRVDQYMLGLLAWQMVTGQRPPQVSQPDSLLTQGRAAFGHLPSVCTLRPLVPRQLDQVIARMTARRPRDRYPDLATVLREVERIPDIGLLIAQDSWQRVAAQPDFHTGFFERFYRGFFSRAPQAEALFSAFDAAQWRRQHEMLQEAVLLLLAFHHHGEDAREPNVLSRIAASHRRLPPALFSPFMEALVATVCGDDALGIPPADPLAQAPRERDALEDYWRTAIEPGIRWLASRSGA